MFCGNCGSKVVEGNVFCVTCGRAQHSPSVTESVAVPMSVEGSKTPDVEFRAVHPAASAGVPVTQPAEKPLYCRHSSSERTKLGMDMYHGSDICMGCRLPFSPDSPNSGMRPSIGRSAPLPRPGEKLSIFQVWVRVAVLALILGSILFGLISRGQGQQSGPAASNSGPAASNSGPTASAMGCTDTWTLVKSNNGINIYDCDTAYGSGHQTLWRFDDAGAQASFMDTMSRAIRPKGHLVYSDNWAVISDSTESFRAAINAGGQDYGS
jgi:hypothetical protein